MASGALEGASEWKDGRLKALGKKTASICLPLTSLWATVGGCQEHTKVRRGQMRKGLGAPSSGSPTTCAHAHTAINTGCPPRTATSRQLCYSRAGACLTAFLLLLLATLGTLLALVAILGLPSRTPAAQACVTLTNRTGFLCHDRSRCIPASSVCDGVQTCSHGEDEDEALCRNVPHSLPNFLVAPCGDPTSWIYTDQRCDGINNCGDCSDEQSPVTECLPCGPGWWPCPPTFYKYCDCIPRSLCRDGRQHCTDWSDENSCLRP